MMQFINENDFIVADKDVDFVNYANPELLADDTLNKSLKKYLLLTHYPEKFKNVDQLNIYYNRYYWFLKFWNLYFKKFNNDNLNLRQQEFKILEEGEIYSNIDWTIMEEISKEIKKQLE